MSVFEDFFKLCKGYRITQRISFTQNVCKDMLSINVNVKKIALNSVTLTQLKYKHR